jgi:hypothetical protein
VNIGTWNFIFIVGVSRYCKLGKKYVTGIAFDVCAFLGGKSYVVPILYSPFVFVAGFSWYVKVLDLTM